MEHGQEYLPMPPRAVRDCVNRLSAAGEGTGGTGIPHPSCAFLHMRDIRHPDYCDASSTSRSADFCIHAIFRCTICKNVRPSMRPKVPVAAIGKTASAINA